MFLPLQILKVKDTTLSITADDIVKLKQKAARYQGMTDDVIEDMKKDMREEAERIAKYIQDETKKGIRKLHSFCLKFS